jgi:bifunctional enzyme CysN/CysC
MPELVRFSTAGSVDDGKSTLIGRLLYDTKTLFEDQLAAVERSSQRLGLAETNLALITDGLRAEREQGITIDVAYRYFATPKRKFIIADTPGHVQYTRNMVTGSSMADAALILVDARKGLVEQSRRHAFLATLLRIPHLAVCVNKMDLVDYSQERFEEIKAEFEAFATRLEVADLAFIPVSALKGDNVVDRSAAMNWYDGATLLGYLEGLYIASDRNLVDCRFPVQYVIRPRSDDHHDYRGYAGQIAGGVWKPGDSVVVLPSGWETTVASIDGPRGGLDEAFPTMSVVIRLADDLDIGRGDMLCRPGNQPIVTQDVEATVAWMVDKPLAAGSKYVLKHTTRSVRALVKDVRYRLDVNTLRRDEAATSLDLNEIGRVSFRTTSPVMVDAYRRNRTTGSFILIDEVTNTTAGAGMILEHP